MASSAKSLDQQSAIVSTSPIFGATIFLSAFLLFQVQLIIGKSILPWFGGTGAVWTTCMLVFQLLLLAGYAYAHLLSSKTPLGTQVRIHTVVLMIGVVALIACAIVWRVPILPSESWKPPAEGSQVLQIIRMLMVAVAIPFFLLSTTGSLVQHWFAHASGGQSPYRLYSLSNAGSLLGLICYPLVFEPVLSLRQQAWIWSALFSVFVGLCIWTARQTECAGAAQLLARAVEEEEEKPGKLRYALWIALPACASTMLLAATNHVCQDVAVVPLLWMLPLAIYLLSFILTFDTPKWYQRGFYHPLYVISVFAAASGLVRHDYKPMAQIAISLLVMFAVCMVMHGELVRIRPHSKHLTAFYLMVAVGGGLGGIFVSVIAPHVFPAYWEYPIAMVLCGLLGFCVLLADRNSWLQTVGPAMALPMLLAAAVFPWVGSKYVDPKFFSSLNTPWYYLALLSAGAVAAVLLAVTKKQVGSSVLNVAYQSCAMVLVVALGVLLAQEIRSPGIFIVERHRGFFGVVTVEHGKAGLSLRHGQTTHGWQLADPALSQIPTAYYVVDSGVGLALREYPVAISAGRPETYPMRVGVVGLGVGTLAAYGRTGDQFHFYEIDSNVINLSTSAHPQFTYLKNSHANIEMTLGDARLSLEREPSQKFDILVLDAFSSDSIPVHLLTREAMQIYKRHLRGPRSLLIFHTSNNAVDLRPVLLGLGKDSGFHVIHAGVVHPRSPNEWILLCEDKDFLLSIPGIRETAMNINLNGPAPLWTDDYSNLVQVLNF